MWKFALPGSCMIHLANGGVVSEKSQNTCKGLNQLVALGRLAYAKTHKESQAVTGHARATRKESQNMSRHPGLLASLQMTQRQFYLPTNQYLE
ncbi:hypothetical protein C8R44DRAFT_756053 [Mycena epipterygia]|nr:hypothetical protein C8R44DRAFT_756053 [Mycena epipterygia]